MQFILTLLSVHANFPKMALKLIGAMVIISAYLLLGATSTAAQATDVSVFFNNKAGFDAAIAGKQSVMINFDNIATGTDITGQTISGVNFTSSPAPLLVV